MKYLATVLAGLALCLALPAMAETLDAAPIAEVAVQDASQTPAVDAQPEWILFHSVLSRALAIEPGYAEQNSIPPYNCTYNPCDNCSAERECCIQNWCDPGDFDCVIECHMRYRQCAFTCG